MEKTAETREELVKDVNQLKADVAKIAQDAKSHANAQVDDARQRVTEAWESLQQQIASHPLAILGFGMLLGFIFGRRSRRRV